MRRWASVWAVCACAWMVVGCSERDTFTPGDSNGDTAENNNIVNEPPEGEQSVGLELRFSTDADASCVIASTTPYTTSDGVTELVTVTISGVIRAFDADTGQERWRKVIEAPEGQSPIVVATPRRSGDLLVMVWQNALIRDGLPDQGVAWPKVSHHARVLDLSTHDWHEDFALLDIQGTVTGWDGRAVAFEADKHLSRCRVGRLPVGDGRGLFYISYGVGGGGHPYHGWLFELDLDAWQAQGPGAAIRNILATNTDSAQDCQYNNEDILVSEVCGAGVWTPSGPLETTDASGAPELIVPTGNGRVHLGRDSWSHGLLRVQPGLDFDPLCDPELCADFDESDPSLPCLESCQDYFVPRLKPDETFQPASGMCDGETFMECYGTLDADFGSSSPVEIALPSGRRVLVHPAKDGAFYLIDREHMGHMWDRIQTIEPCGTTEDTCPAVWAGQFVTTPVVHQDGDTTLVIASGFNFDRTHAAGVVAVRVVEDPEPRLELAWTAPDFSEESAVQVFRRHPGRPILHTVGDETYVFLAEVADPGKLWVIRARDGLVVARQPLQSRGARYTLPVIHDGTIYINMCSDPAALADGHIEAYNIQLIDRDGSVTPDLSGDGESTPGCEKGGSLCADDEYCQRERCGGPGGCLPRPLACDASGPQVCGCDGVTYTNRCEAERAGVYADQEGACP